MKLHFEPNLDFQLQAVEAVCDLLRGQEVCRTDFTVTRAPAKSRPRFGFAEHDLGVGNRLTLHDEEILQNLKEIHDINALASAIPYCDVVVTDKEMVSHANRNKLTERMNTVMLASLSDLREYL